jgi:regulation of enolase protein 1 (concanavalin A-like superfamily)
LSRTTTAGATSAAFTSGAAPYWVRLVRSGSTFTAYRSPDGITWKQSGSSTISMTATVYIGLAVCSKNTTTLNTSTFTNVSVTGATGAATLSSLTLTPSSKADKSLTWAEELDALLI